MNVVGDDEKKFKVPDFNVTPKPTIRGRLIDNDGNPMKETTIAIYLRRAGYTNGRAKTDKEGNFEMQVGQRLKEILRFGGAHFAIETEAVTKNKLPTFEELEVINPEILDTDENLVDGLQLKRLAEE